MSVDNELMYLNAINEVLKTNLSTLPSDLKPKKRDEIYLAQIFNNLAGISSSLPIDLKPTDRREILLAVIEQNSRDLHVGGGSGGSSGGVTPPLNPDEFGMTVTQWNEVIPTRKIDRIGDVRTNDNIVQTKVADDVYFGNNKFNDYVNTDGELFIYNTDVLKITNSELVFIPANNAYRDVEVTAEWLNGDLRTLELDNTETDSFEKAKFRLIKRKCVTTPIKLTSENFSEVKGYAINNQIGIITEHNEKCTTNLQSDNETFTYVTVEVDENNFNEIKELQ